MVSSVLIKYGAGKPPRSPAPNRIPATLWGKLTLRFGADVERFRGIGEYKIDRGHRIYLAKDGLKIIVLLGGGSKKRQQHRLGSFPVGILQTTQIAIAERTAGWTAANLNSCVYSDPVQISSYVLRHLARAILLRARRAPRA